MAGAVLPVLVVYLWNMRQPDIAEPVLPFLVALAMIGVLAVVLAAAFGLGFRLSALKTIRFTVIVVTAIAYLVPLLLLSFIPTQTHAMVVDLPAEPDLLMPVGAIILVLFALPLGVAFAVARLSSRGDNSSNNSQAS